MNVGIDQAADHEVPAEIHDRFGVNRLATRLNSCDGPITNQYVRGLNGVARIEDVDVLQQDFIRGNRRCDEQQQQ